MSRWIINIYLTLHCWTTSLLTAIKLAKTKQNIRETETDLKSITAKEEYFQIEETIKANEAKTKRLLHQRKFKKFNSLKYKPETTREETLQPIKEPLHLRNHMQMPYQVQTISYTATTSHATPVILMWQLDHRQF